jgi:nucleoside-diphosphate-sugar epimerase
MKKVLVTGATGFIGNYVVEDLLRQGYEVIATSQNHEKARMKPWFASVSYKALDIKNVDSQTDYFEYFLKPQKVIHLAWEGLPNYKSLHHFEINLPCHYAFLKNLVMNGCDDITVTGTCFEYGMRNGILSEDMDANPGNAYAVAKDSLNKFLSELHKTKPFSLRWVRLFYMHGKGQGSSSLFSQLQSALDNNEEVFNMSGGEQVRDYLPVETVASYINRIALQNKVTGVINCCSGSPVTIKDLVEDYIKERHKKIKLNLGYYKYPEYEPMAFWGDNKKLQSIINE